MAFSVMVVPSLFMILLLSRGATGAHKTTFYNRVPRLENSGNSVPDLERLLLQKLYEVADYDDDWMTDDLTYDDGGVDDGFEDFTPTSNSYQRNATIAITPSTISASVNQYKQTSTTPTRRKGGPRLVKARESPLELTSCDGSESLGVPDRSIIFDSQLTSSSEYPDDGDGGSCRSADARLHGASRRAWCAGTRTTSEWLQLDIGGEATITAVATQGRADTLEWVTGYRVSYAMLENGPWNYVMNHQGDIRLFAGNYDAYSTQKSFFTLALRLRFIRFHPQTWQGHPSMRVDVFGCHTCHRTTIGAFSAFAATDASSERFSRRRRYKTLPMYDKPHSRTRKRRCESGDIVLAGSGGWCPRRTNSRPWIEVDFGADVRVFGVITKGRNSGRQRHWITAYSLEFQSSHDSEFRPITDGQGQRMVFDANTDADSPRANFLPHSLVARRLRLLPATWHRSVGLRLGAIVCRLATNRCPDGAARLTPHQPVCLENIASQRRTFGLIANDDDMSMSKLAKRSDVAKGEFDTLVNARRSTADGCMWIDNYNLQIPAMLVDLGDARKISGVVLKLVTNGTEAEKRSALAAIEKITVFASDIAMNRVEDWLTAEQLNDEVTFYKYNSAHGRVNNNNNNGKVRRSRSSPPMAGAQHDAVCGEITNVDQTFATNPRLHMPCSRVVAGRFLYVAIASFDVFPIKFNAQLCHLMVYR